MGLMDKVESFIMRSRWIGDIPEAVASAISGPLGCGGTSSTQTPKSAQNVLELEPPPPPPQLSNEEMCHESAVQLFSLRGVHDYSEVKDDIAHAKNSCIHSSNESGLARECYEELRQKYNSNPNPQAYDFGYFLNEFQRCTGLGLRK